MSKAKSAALRRDIARLATAIHQRHSMLNDAGKKELSFIHKHLRKAAKAIEVSVRAAAPAGKGKKKAAAGRTMKQRPPRTKPKATLKPKPPVEEQGAS